MTARRSLPLLLTLALAGCGSLLGGRNLSPAPRSVSAQPRIAERPGVRRAGSDVSLPIGRTAPWWSALLYCPSGLDAATISPDASNACIHADSVGANLGPPPNPVIGRVP
jgi:hypothetical protein